MRPLVIRLHVIKPCRQGLKSASEASRKTKLGKTIDLQKIATVTLQFFSLKDLRKASKYRSFARKPPFFFIIITISITFLPSLITIFGNIGQLPENFPWKFVFPPFPREVPLSGQK
jgi:hypothetical protein